MNNTLYKNNCDNVKWISGTLIAAVVFISLFVLSRDIFGMNLNKFILIGVTAVFMFFLDKNEMIALMAFITPLSAGISYNYLSAIALILFIVKSNGKIKANLAGVIYIVAILIIEMISALFWEFSFVDFLIFVGIFLFSFLKMLDDEEYDNRKIVLFFIIGFWVAVISLYGQVIAEYGLKGLSDFADNLDRFGNTNQLLGYKEGMRVSYNPNGLGVICMQTTLFSLLMFRVDGKTYQVISAILAIFIGITTQSRTYYIVASAALIVFFMFSRSNSKDFVRKISISVVSIAAFCYAITHWLRGYLEAFGNRMQSDDILNGRGEIALEYFEKFFENPLKILIGVGLQDYNKKYELEMASHNATQEIMLTWGLLGLLCVVLLFLVVFKNLKLRNANFADKIVFTLPFFATLLYMQTGQGFTDVASMLRMMVIVSAINLINIGRENETKNEGDHLYSNI